MPLSSGKAVIRVGHAQNRSAIFEGEHRRAVRNGEGLRRSYAAKEMGLWKSNVYPRRGWEGEIRRGPSRVTAAFQSRQDINSLETCTQSL